MTTKSPKIAFLTLGCVKNEVDSDYMRCLVERAGYEVLDSHVDFGIDSYTEADVVILNTCAFLEMAVTEGIDTIFELLSLPKFEAGEALLLVCGCMPARYGDTLVPELPEVDAFLTFEDEPHIVDKLQQLLGVQLQEIAPDMLPQNTRSLGKPSAYVKISDGCSRFCSYCMIPYIRGPYHSRSYHEIAEEIEELVNSGTKEIILIAQDTGIWGRDLAVLCNEPYNLATLLKALATRFPQTWLRVLYTQPEAIDAELLAVIKNFPNVCNYLDIPLQHVSPRILTDMNRTGDSDTFLALVQTARETIPGITLRTTFMAGFPGETDEDIALLEDFVDKASFNYAGVFSFSPEEGTAAALMENQLSEDIKQDRAQTIRDAADAVAFPQIEALIGEELDVLVCGYELDLETDEQHLYGRTQGQAPDVDGITYLQSGQVGTIVRARIIDSCCYDLFTEPV